MKWASEARASAGVRGSRPCLAHTAGGTMRRLQTPLRREAAYSPDLLGRGARGDMTVLLSFFQVAAATWKKRRE
jgi:hypothetical protein